MQLWQNCAHSWRNCTVCTFVAAASLVWSYASVVHIANVGQGVTKRTFSWQNASKCARRSAGPRISCDSGSTLASVKPQPTRSTAYASLPAASSSGMSMRNSKQEASKLLRNTNGGLLPPAAAACEHVLKRSLVIAHIHARNEEIVRPCMCCFMDLPIGVWQRCHLWLSYITLDRLTSKSEQEVQSAGSIPSGRQCRKYGSLHR